VSRMVGVEEASLWYSSCPAAMIRSHQVTEFPWCELDCGSTADMAPCRCC
jgi:hypothetical protein